MSYTPTTWTTGDTITATKLNKLEQGVASAGVDYDFIIEATNNGGYVATKGTYSDVYTALQTRPVIGLYKRHTTSGQNLFSWYLPLTYVWYYSSTGNIIMNGITQDAGGTLYHTFVWSSDGTIIED